MRTNKITRYQRAIPSTPNICEYHIACIRTPGACTAPPPHPPPQSVVQPEIEHGAGHRGPVAVCGRADSDRVSEGIPTGRILMTLCGNTVKKTASILPLSLSEAEGVFTRVPMRGFLTTPLALVLWRPTAIPAIPLFLHHNFCWVSNP